MQKKLRAGEEQGVLEQVAAPLLARGIPVGGHAQSARAALARAGAERSAAAAVAELSVGETVASHSREPSSSPPP